MDEKNFGAAGPAADRTAGSQCQSEVADRKTAHTPGPWYSEAAAKDGRRNGALVFAHGATGGRVRIAEVGNMGSDYAEDEANAARIVACVNACEGMDTPEASIAFLRERGEALTEANAQLAATERERDELAAALKKVNQELWSKSVSVRRRPTLDELRAMFLDTRDALEGIK